MSTNLSANVTTSDGLDLPARHQQALFGGNEQQLKQIRANAVKQAKEHRGQQAAEWQKRAFSKLDKAFMKGFMRGGGPVSSNVTANDQRLDFEEFEDQDEDTLQEVRYQLGITDSLLSAGFSTSTSLARTVYVQERESKWEQDGEISMDGRAKSNDDEAVLEIFGTPVTICHVDYEISARQQQQSQNFGEDIETRKARQAGRILRETEEDQTLDGRGPTVEDARGNTVTMFGMRDSSVAISGTAAGDWGSPSNVLDTIDDDILNPLETQTADNNRGPMPEEQGLWLWYHPNQRSDLRAADPRGDGNMSLMQRIERDYPYIEMQANGALDDGEIVAMVQDQRFGEILNAQAPTNLSEEVDFGLATKYKALSARVPFFKSTYDGVRGIVNLTGA